MLQIPRTSTSGSRGQGWRKVVRVVRLGQRLETVPEPFREYMPLVRSISAAQEQWELTCLQQSRSAEKQDLPKKMEGWKA
eukprot:4093474-Amphidinium_carterae.1